MSAYQLTALHVATLAEWAHDKWAHRPENASELSVAFLVRTEFLRRHPEHHKYRPTLAGLAVLTINKLSVNERDFLDRFFTRGVGHEEWGASPAALIESLRGKGLLYTVDGHPRLAGSTVKALAYMRNL